MTIEELIILLNNRLAAFKQARDYARMSGNLEAMNAADKEVVGIQETLFKLKLLVPTASIAAPEATATEMPSSVGAEPLALYDITSYATDPLHEQKIEQILTAMGEMRTADDVDTYIQGTYPESPVLGQMVVNAAVAEEVDGRLMMAIMQQDSSFGTAGMAISTLNPGNVGNDDAGNTRTYDSWQEGVTAVAEWLSWHRITPTPTPTPEPIDPFATSTPPTTDTGTTTPPVPEFPIPTATSTPPMSTSTPPTDTGTTTPSVPEVSEPLPPAPEEGNEASTTPEVAEPTLLEQPSLMSTTTPTQ